MYVLYNVCKHLFCVSSSLFLLMGRPKPTLGEDNPKVYYSANSPPFETTTGNRKKLTSSGSAAVLFMSDRDDFSRWLLLLNIDE